MAKVVNSASVPVFLFFVFLSILYLNGPNYEYHIKFEAYVHRKCCFLLWLLLLFSLLELAF